MHALTSLEGLEQLAVIRGEIEITVVDGKPSLEGLQGVTAWRGRQGVVTPLVVGSVGAPLALDPSERSWLDWLKTAELPSSCTIMVEVQGEEPTTGKMDAELAALCER